MKSRNYDMQKISDVLELLKIGKPLPRQDKDHQLKGNLKEFRELHITNNVATATREDEQKVIAMTDDCVLPEHPYKSKYPSPVPNFSTTKSMSLSPRPERFTKIDFSGVSVARFSA